MAFKIWSSGHAEQLLFSCLGSKVSLTLFHFHQFRYFHYFHYFHYMLNNFCFYVYAQKSLSHSFTFTTFAIFTTFTTFTLSFTLSRHAEQVLFSCLGSKFAAYSQKLQCFFWDLILGTSPPDITVHRAGSQLKSLTALILRSFTFVFHQLFGS